MSGAFNRERLPGWQDYADIQGLVLVGRGKWRSLLCDFHADTEPSLRVNTESGGWCCMSCGAKGGDTLAHYMQRFDVDFVQAAKDLGAWDADKLQHTERKPQSLAARDAMQLAAAEMRLAFVVIADVRAGVIPNDDDWLRFIDTARRVEIMAQEYAS